MISKEEFLRQVKERVFPLIDLKKRDKMRRICLITAICLYVIVLVLCLCGFISHPPKGSKASIDAIKITLFIPIVVAGIVSGSIWETYARRTKKNLRPTILNILHAAHISEQDLPEPSVKQLRKLHFLPRFDSRDNDKIQNDSFGLLQEPLPFYIQEVSFSTGGKHPDIFQGPLIRFFLPQPSDFTLMVIKRQSLLYKDKVSLSVKKSLDTLLGSQNWQLLTMESPKFNKSYFAFTNDQIRARSILTPRFMEHIRDVETVYNAPTNFMFYHDQLLLMVKTNRNMFEFSTISKNINSYSRFYDEIATLYKFQDFFKLK